MPSENTSKPVNCRTQVRRIYARAKSSKAVQRVTTELVSYVFAERDHLLLDVPKLFVMAGAGYTFCVVRNHSRFVKNETGK